MGRWRSSSGADVLPCAPRWIPLKGPQRSRIVEHPAGAGQPLIERPEAGRAKNARRRAAQYFTQS